MKNLFFYCQKKDYNITNKDNIIFYYTKKTRKIYLIIIKKT